MRYVHDAAAMPRRLRPLPLKRMVYPAMNCHEWARKYQNSLTIIALAVVSSPPSEVSYSLLRR